MTSPTKVPSKKERHRDDSYSLDQRWHYVGSIVNQMFTNGAITA